jgi:hypothetical protein
MHLRFFSTLINLFTMAATYEIYHPIDGMNHLCEEGFKYKKVADIEATSLEDAFRQTQNDFSPGYRKHKIRSTSVGDILRKHGDDGSVVRCYIVKNLSFDFVPDSWIGK